MKTLLNNIIKFFTIWNELLLGPIAVILWFVSPYLIHNVDETAATYDAAVFQKIFFALVAFCTFSFSGWLLLRIQFPSVFKYLAEDFEKDFVSLNPNQLCVKLILSLCVLAYYLLGLVLCGLIL